jgi:hypothetical protein
MASGCRMPFSDSEKGKNAMTSAWKTFLVRRCLIEGKAPQDLWREAGLEVSLEALPSCQERRLVQTC